MIDFDALFTKYILEWHTKNADKYTPAQIEDMAADLYDKWTTAPCVELKGISPRDYFKGFKADKLISLLNEYNNERMPVPSLLLDEISVRKDTEAYLIEVLKVKPSAELTMAAVNLLNEQQSDKLNDEILPWVFDTSLDAELREIAAEIIARSAEYYVEDIIKAISESDSAGKIYAADILVNIPDDDRVFSLLLDLFKTGDNIPLYASYLGKYGNESAVEVLKLRLEDCNYMEFIEIVNAIEQLGGTVNVERDWSNDYYYAALKGAN